MASFRLSRRAMLRGAGSIAIALPFLEVMRPEPVARAASLAKRFVAVYTPGGTVRDRWTPTGGETDFVLSPILKPLEPFRNHLLIPEGLEMKCAIGEQHQAGIIGWLTGSKQTGSPGDYSSFASIDQVLATRISQGKARQSLQMAVRWATGKSHGLLHPINAAIFEDNASHSPIPPRIDPVAIFQDLFGSLAPTSFNNGAPELDRKKSILDFTGRKYASLAQKLGSRDRQKLEQHLSKIREIEQGLQVVVRSGGQCQAPAFVTTKGYEPTAGLASADNGSAQNVTTDELIPAVGTFMMDMLVMALACDLTAVSTLQWADTEAKHTFPWLGLTEHHHFYQHDGGFRPEECEKIGTWYTQQHAYLLGEMAKVDMGGHTLLDESIVFFGSELADPSNHDKSNMPFLLAGKGGGLRTGRYVRYDNASHNDLLVSILNLFGDERKTYGHAEFCTGPLPNLL